MKVILSVEEVCYFYCDVMRNTAFNLSMIGQITYEVLKI